jgi:hypothetical protein
MNALFQAIDSANTSLTRVGLPRSDQVVELLQAAENKLAEMQGYHAAAAQSIEVFRDQINMTLDSYPYP